MFLFSNNKAQPIELLFVAVFVVLVVVIVIVIIIS